MKEESLADLFKSKTAFDNRTEGSLMDLQEEVEEFLEFVILLVAMESIPLKL